MTNSRIIIADEKHATRYLAASTDEEWAASSLLLLTERFQAGYWYPEPPPSHANPHRVPTVDLAPGAELPNEMRKLMQQQQQLHDRWKKTNAEDRLWYEEARRVVENQEVLFEERHHVRSGKLLSRQPWAWTLLRSRAEYEYEEVRLETVESPLALTPWSVH